MFGDIGHGLLLLVFSIFLFSHRINPNKSSPLDELYKEARYILVLMGFFATFCGFIYNDFFGM